MNLQESKKRLLRDFEEKEGGKGYNYIDRGFCPTHFHNHSVSNKYTELYIIYKLTDQLAWAYY